MALALGECMKGVNHLWCKWHVFRPAQEKLGPIYNVGTPFHDEFNKIINEMYTEDEFEAAWDMMLDKYNLRGNEFMSSTYNKRHRWAKAFNKGTYYAGMTSTQRSESANHMLKKHVPRNSSMNRFVLNCNNLLLARYREEETQEHLTKQHNKAKQRERYERISFIVRVEDGGEYFNCDCGLFSHLGIICFHVLWVMLQLCISSIPERHILIRWTKNARKMLPGHLNFYKDVLVVALAMTYRHRLLAANAAQLIKEGDDDGETCDIAIKFMKLALAEIGEYKKKKASCDVNGIISEYDTSCNEGGDDSEEDGEACGNYFGAASCSAGLSDSELMSLRPPIVARRKAGRPRANRYKSRLDFVKKKIVKRPQGAAPGRKKDQRARCTTCDIAGHDASECLVKEVHVGN